MKFLIDKTCRSWSWFFALNRQIYLTKNNFGWKITARSQILKNFNAIHVHVFGFCNSILLYSGLGYKNDQ